MDGTRFSLPELPLSRQAGWGSPSQMPCLTPALCWRPQRGSTSTLKPQPPFRLPRIWLGGDGQAGGKAPVLQKQAGRAVHTALAHFPRGSLASGFALTCWPRPQLLL